MTKKLLFLVVPGWFVFQFTVNGMAGTIKSESSIQSIKYERPISENREALTVDLEKCIDIALARNHRRKVSRLSVSIAEQQHSQALSAYWPKLLLNSSYHRTDEDVNFIFPEETSQYGRAFILRIVLYYK